MTRGRAPVFAETFPGAPGAVEPRLVIGSALFGAGWGLSGFCPGPALAALSFGGWPIALFTIAMIAGMGVHNVALAPRALRA